MRAIVGLHFTVRYLLFSLDDTFSRETGLLIPLIKKITIVERIAVMRIRIRIDLPNSNS